LIAAGFAPKIDGRGARGATMTGELDAAGTLAAGSLVARQLDAPAQPPHAAPKLAACANCAAPITGNFCGQCGQTAHVARSIGHIFHDLLHGILHFDSKGWRTLPMLFFRPGRLTREYVEGKRARYVAPFAMFLFTVFVMYFTFAFIGAPEVDLEGAVKVDAADIAEVKAEIAAAEANLARLEARQRAIAARTPSAPGEAAGLRGEIAGQRAALAALRAGLRSAEASTARAAGKPVAPPPAGERSWREELAEAMRAGDITVMAGNEPLNQRFRAALENPDLLFYKMQQSAYKFSFLLVPLSLPFVWLLFPFRRGTHLYDHVVFTLYSLAFVSLLFVLAAILASVGLIAVGTAVALCLFIPPAHMFVQLKGAYGLGWFGALARTLLLSVFAIIVLSLFLVAVIALGVI
jgi:Protein of unknown function (DUF3667)